MANRVLFAAVLSGSLLVGCSHRSPSAAVIEHGGLRAARDQARHEHRLGQLEANVLALEARLQTLQAQLRAHRDAKGQVPQALSVERWLPGPANELQELVRERPSAVTGRGTALRVEP